MYRLTCALSTTTTCNPPHLNTASTHDTELLPMSLTFTIERFPLPTLDTTLTANCSPHNSVSESTGPSALDFLLSRTGFSPPRHEPSATNSCGGRARCCQRREGFFLFNSFNSSWTFLTSPVIRLNILVCPCSLEESSSIALPSLRIEVKARMDEVLRCSTQLCRWYSFSKYAVLKAAHT